MACFNSIIDAVGNTPIVKLNNTGSDFETTIFVKCEFMNPGGSIKDRIARFMIDEAEKSGALKSNGTIIEATSGNTGMGLAIVAALRGYPCIFVMADKQSVEKQDALKSLGAKVIMCPTDVPADDPRSYYETAARIARDTPNSFYVQQYFNANNPLAHYKFTGPEIWEQMGEKLDTLICSIGTGGTVSGLSKYLREKNSEIKIIGVDPIGSIFYDLFYSQKMIEPQAYLIEGIGEDFLPDTIDMAAMDEIVQVNDEESFQMARHLLQKEGLLCGGSSGSAVVGALRYLRTLEKNKQPKPNNLLVILPDASSRYSSKFIKDKWMVSHGFSTKYAICD